MMDFNTPAQILESFFVSLDYSSPHVSLEDEEQRPCSDAWLANKMEVVTPPPHRPEPTTEEVPLCQRERIAKRVSQ